MVGIVKEYHTIAPCGLDCGLCTKYYTVGASRCPGCCGPDFFNKHPSCAYITCCVKKKGLEACGQCEEFPCSRFKAPEEYETMDSPSYPPYSKVIANLNFVKEHGIEPFVELQSKRIGLLEAMLKDYDEGRSRRFYCRAAALLSIAGLEASLNDAGQSVKAATIGANDVKTRAKIMKGSLNECAAIEGIELKK